jgi:hypothetical protein
MEQNILIEKDTFGDYIKYTCKLSKSYIVLKNIKNIINYDESYFDWNNPKLIINLLNFVFNDLENIDNTYKYRYYVYNNELKYIDLDKWTIIKKEDDKTLLECDISNALNNTLDGFIKN